MKVSDLWRKRYDEVVFEKEKLELKVSTLTYRLYATLGYAILLSIYHIFNNK